jgi:flagellin-like hook-associated protein FlgL
MRVANKTIYDIIKFNLGNITEELNKANKIVSTGKRITDLSDDPVGITQALDIKSTLSNIEQLERNINFGKPWLNSAESALSSVQNLISDARALCVEMATATKGAAERASAANTIIILLP